MTLRPSRSRSAYAIPMGIGLLGSVASIGLLVSGVVIGPTTW
jgi:hypothetical protein